MGDRVGSEMGFSEGSKGSSLRPSFLGLWINLDVCGSEREEQRSHSDTSLGAGLELGVRATVQGHPLG